MIKLRTGLFLAGAMAAMMMPATGAPARNIKAKPAPAVCAEARARGQILPGCPRPDNGPRQAPPAPAPAPPPDAPSPPEGEIDSAGEEQDDRRPREALFTCPGDRRCPK